MARTRVSYAEAVRLLLGAPDAATVAGRRAAGGLLLAVAPLAPEVVLSLFDAKGEANNLLRDLVGRAPARIRGARGKRHYELLEAAHGIVVLSSFFDAVAEVHGPRFTALELTDDEKRHLATTGLGRELRNPVAPMPGATRGFAENVGLVEGAMRLMAGRFGDFVGKLAEGRNMPGLDATEIDRAVAIYCERYVALAADVPEFAIWSQLDEHAATRAEIREQNETLARLEATLARLVDAPTPATEAEQRLANHAAQVLREPVWQAESSDITFPAMEQAFITPRFRLARADKDSRLADDEWWSGQGEHEDLAAFLAAYLTDPMSTERPLVILGLPGAGKSLLTKILAARLPAEVFTTFRVPLRAVDPDADIYKQVETTVERLIHERLEWAALCRASDTTKVVLLDGFDELIQATGVTQSNFLDRAARFQQAEWVNERSVAVVVTSRTLVMDRTAVPEGTLVLKLEPFDDHQIEQWIDTWNAANAHAPSARELTTAELERHKDLAEQPLLLLMLAIYAASGGMRLDAEELSTEGLYGRLLDLFIRRQIRDKAKKDLDEETLTAGEAESRRDLATVAYAMFNRGHQWVSESDVDADLLALEEGGAPAVPVSSRSVTRAQRTITGFFFVHTAHTGEEAHAPERRTYEFMHATFGEYLIAEQTAKLLRDLAEDWRRSRSRAYGTRLDDRILRALLSHQPLSSREQILPFLDSLLGRMETAERGDLRHALLDLYREARRSVPDDPYRPTPFDAVGRLAAYTANLVLLATLSSPPKGLPVTALSGRPGTPDFASTVGLWRSGLEYDAATSLFDTLFRSGDDLRISFGAQVSVSLPIAEARLIGDRAHEAMLWTGEKLTPRARLTGMTDFQVELHGAVVQLMRSRWSTPLLERVMPYDEQDYFDLAELAESDDESAAADTVALLALLLIDEDRRLPTELVDRLVTSMISPDLIPDVQPLLSMLAFGRPELFGRHPAFVKGVLETDSPAFLYELATSPRNSGRPDVAELAARLADRLTSPDSRITITVDVLPSMVRTLAFAPHRLAAVIKSLNSYGTTSWEQVRPSDLLAALDLIEDERADLTEPLSNYLAVRAGDEDVVAMEEIGKRVDRRAGDR
ncbi:NACHT domain-containing protein [Actinoplanes sp. CA-131856]